MATSVAADVSADTINGTLHGPNHGDELNNGVPRSLGLGHDTGSAIGDGSDPFVSTPGPSAAHQRFSNFDTQLFALHQTTSPAQAKRALEAHLTETERRIQEASKLGTTLVRQRQDLADRIKDVELQQKEGNIGPELRQKLIDIEKEYNEVGRESARAFLPKSRVSSNEHGTNSPYAPDGRVCRFPFLAFIKAPFFCWLSFT